MGRSWAICKQRRTDGEQRGYSWKRSQPRFWDWAELKEYLRSPLTQTNLSQSPHLFSYKPIAPDTHLRQPFSQFLRILHLQASWCKKRCRYTNKMEITTPNKAWWTVVEFVHPHQHLFGIFFWFAIRPFEKHLLHKERIHQFLFDSPEIASMSWMWRSSFHMSLSSSQTPLLSMVSSWTGRIR